MLADERDVNAVVAKAGEVRGCRDARLAHKGRGVVDEVGHAKRVRDISLHRAKIAIVDPKERVARVREPNMIDHAVQVGGIVNFEQRGHPEFDRKDLEIDDLALREALGDEEDRVGADGA